MRRTLTPATSFWSALVLLVLVTLPATVRAQSFSGSGQQATELFTLAEGLAVFEFNYEGTAQFVVQLLDADGKMVGELARAAGPLKGSRALRIDHRGRYLLDVSATGRWTITLREGQDAAGAVADRPPADVVRTDSAGAPGTAATGALLEGRTAGIAAAGNLNTGWGLRGLLGGTLAGPVGLGLAVHYAGRSDIHAPPPAAPADALFTKGFREGFETRTKTVRRKSAFVGGMVGTAILTAALIHFINISGSGSGTPGNGGNGGNPPDLGIVR